MKHTKTTVNGSDHEWGDDNDDDDWATAPFSHLIFTLLGVGRRKSW